jgi:hypothetical protein
MSSISRNFLMILLLIITSCSHNPKNTVLKLPNDNTGVLNLVKQSYIKGCVETHHLYSKKKVYHLCLENSEKYIKDISEIIK